MARITNHRDTPRSQRFTYDALNRIQTAQTAATYATHPSTCWAETFTYDVWANLLSIAGIHPEYTGCTQENLSVSVTAKNQISGNTYDAAGNMTFAPAMGSYAYDAENRMTATAGVSYAYDGDGKRVKKSNGKLYWYSLGLDPLAESDLTGNLTDEYIFFGGKRIARRTVSSGAVNYYFADHLGSSRVVTNAAGTVLDDSDFYPFGGERVVSSSSGNTYKFTGKERDSESGLDYFGARYYGSTMGRFTSPDPVIVTPERFYDPQQFNLYAYVRNSPLRFVDPSGETLTVSGDIQAAIEYLCDVAGGSCGRISYDKSTNTITIEIEGQQDWDYDERSHKFLHNEIAQNEGLSLLIELVSSKNHYDLFVGSTVETKGGFLQFDHVVNLDNNPDNRYNKTDAFRPKEGVDAQIALDPRVQTTSNTKLKPATPGSIIFHELAEAYAKVDRGKQYAQAHQEAFDRESRLRDQRPYLKQHNLGAGPGDSHRQIQPTKLVIRR